MASGFEKIEEGAYFAVDLTSFSLPVMPFEPLVAGQTICYTWQDLPEEGQGLPDDVERRTRQEEYTFSKEVGEAAVHTSGHNVGYFIGRALSQIPEVEYVLVKEEKTFLSIWTVIDKLDRSVRHQIYSVEFNIMSKFTEFRFDFHVIARMGRPPQAVLPLEATIIFFRRT